MTEDGIATGPRRIAYFGLGWLFVGLGGLGAALPVLPTVPFLIVAAWAFAHSSRRWHDWLYSHRLFGTMLRDWDRWRVIPWWGKTCGVGAMTASMIWVAFFSDAPPVGVIAMAAVIVPSAIYVLSRPSRRPPEGES